MRSNKYFVSFLFVDRILLCMLGWPNAYIVPAFASKELELKLTLPKKKRRSNSYAVKKNEILE